LTVLVSNEELSTVRQKIFSTFLKNESCFGEKIKFSKRMKTFECRERILNKRNGILTQQKNKYLKNLIET